jgi:hypothetical protein
MNPMSFSAARYVYRTLLGTAVFSIAIATALADDGAASIAAGGLVFKRETRIVMAKEVLTISEKKIVVDYEFRNDTDENVTTEVAFPVPPYSNDFDKYGIAEMAFKSFRLSVNDEPQAFTMEAKAYLHGKDVTASLRSAGIDIASFGHQTENEDIHHTEEIRSQDFERLSLPRKDKLVKAGLFDQSDNFGQGLWTVHLKYHWTQTFPAHAIVRIRHEYQPVLGFSAVGQDQVADRLAGKPEPSGKDAAEKELVKTENLAGFCVDRSSLLAMQEGFKRSEANITDPQDRQYITLWHRWIDFILTTANTWQRPIEDFTLIVERPPVTKNDQTLVSFCSPGAVEKLDGDHFQMHLTNFVPKAELHIGYFSVPLAKAKPAKAQM